MSQTNPFTPPTFEASPVEAPGDHALATPVQRLLAALVDGFVLMVLCVPAILFVALVAAAAGGLEDGADDLLANLILVAVAILGGIPYAAVQAWLVTTRGQTVGKIAVGLRIVRTDGSPVDFVQGVLLRSWVFGLLGAIPCLGNLINIADLLAIFSERHRTLHDRLADTLVVRA